MTEEQYYLIANACDRLLRRSDAPLEWIAIPWLHILNEHPVHLAEYMDLIEKAGIRDGQANRLHSFDRMVTSGRESAYRVASLTRNVIRGAAFADRRRASRDTGRFWASSKSRAADVIIISWLVNVDHLERKDDFYFGNLQSVLADRGISSLLVLRNQTGYPTSSLSEQGKREGPCSRMLLPDVMKFTEELGFIRRCLRARRQLRQAEVEASSLIDRQVAREARKLVVSSAAVANMRLHEQVTDLCRQFRPSVVITLYEGHAWERCVWHAARIWSDSVLCVGYQHTILRKHSHAIKRSLGSDKRYDPDLILTVGDVTRGILEASRDLRDVRVLTFGTHRRNTKIAANDKPHLSSTFLVLPEGIESECIFLFDFALECARRLPSARFIFRNHPVLPFERIDSKLGGVRSLLSNVEISRNTPIEQDFARAGYILYRGSSTVLYGILSGLKPFYVNRDGEMSIDPLEGMTGWREHVRSVEDLVEKYACHQGGTGESNTEEWQRARMFCDSYLKPLNQDVVAQMMELAGKAS